jgi:hypothetical protein
MIEVHDQEFTGPVEVDDTHFLNCRFDSAQLRYAGGPQPRFENCTFNEVGWYFHGAALRTIQLLQMQNQDGSGQAFIDSLFRSGNVISE